MMRKNDGGGNLSYIICTYINVTMKPPVQPIYANKL
jgi:hypothetical protein